MTFLALAITLYASQYFTLNPDIYWPENRDVYIANTFAITGHVAGAVLALALGPFQFLPIIRRP